MLSPELQFLIGVSINILFWSGFVAWAFVYLFSWKSHEDLDDWAFRAAIHPVMVQQLRKQEAKGHRAHDEDMRAALVTSPGQHKPRASFSEREKFYFRSVGLFKLDNPLRRWCLELISSPPFDTFILLLIAANAGCLALEDPMEDPSNPSALSVWLEEIDFLFLLAFTTEMVLKIVALGFILGPHTYMHSGWNLLDVTIVTTAWLPHIVAAEGNSSGIRAFRLLRPLRTIRRFPGLKRLVTAILLAIPQLGNLMVLVLLFFVTLSIVGVQLWSGRWLMRCHNVVNHPSCQSEDAEEGVHCNQYLEFVGDASLFCDLDKPETWAKTCGEMEGAPPQCEKHSENPFSDVMSFDSVLDVFPIVLQLLTLAAWQSLMHISMDTSGPFSVLFFLSGVLLGAYFMMNLFVAVIKDKFDVASAVGAEGEDAFEGIDESGDGLLDPEEIGAIFLKNGVFLTEEELLVVFNKIDDDGSGEVDLPEFMDWLRGSSTMAAKLRNKMSVDGSANSADDDDSLDENDPIGSAKRKLTKLASMHGQTDWSLLFQYYDRDGEGELDFPEFKAALRRDAYITPQQLSNSQLKSLFDHVDADGGGSVSVTEFKEWMEGDSISQVEAETRKTDAVAETNASKRDVAQDLEFEALNQQAGAAVRDMIIKVAQDMLRVSNTSIIDKAISKSETLIDSFVHATEAEKRHSIRQRRLSVTGELGKPQHTDRLLYLHYQPRVKLDSASGDMIPQGEDIFSIRSTRIEPLLAPCIEFKTHGVLWTDDVIRHGGPSRESVMEMIDYNEIVLLSPLRKFIRNEIISRTAFTAVFAFCILANIVILSLDYHGISDESKAQLEFANNICTVLFTVELVCKVLGLTPKEFWGDAFNIFDGFIVITGWLGLLALVGEGFNAFRVFRVFRLFRVLRVLRVISFLNPLRVVFDVLLATLSDLFYILTLTFMFVFIFSILGMQIFGNTFGAEQCLQKFETSSTDCSTGFEPIRDNEGSTRESARLSCTHFEEAERDCVYDDYMPRWHFNSFSIALFTTFQIMTYDSWNSVLVDAVRYNGPSAMFYFVAWILGGALVLMNLLLVIILECYVKEEHKAKARDAEDEVQALASKEQTEAYAKLEDDEEVMVNPLADTTATVVETAGQQTVVEVMPEDDGANVMGASLTVFAIDSPLRKLCVKICLHDYFDVAILFVILMNCATMGMETPFLDIDPTVPRSTKGTVLKIMDFTFTVIFTIEATVRSIAFGFLLGPNAYLNRANEAFLWNRVDFTIVIISWLDFFATSLGIGFLKSLRLMRAFRALRMLNRIKGLQELVVSLGKSMIALSNVMGVTLLVWLIFGLLGLGSFKGLFFSCNDKDAGVEGKLTCVGTFMAENDAGKSVLTPRRWTKPPVNFDTIADSMYTLYECSSQNDWIAKAHFAMDATEIDKQPRLENNTSWGAFFMLFIVVNNFFLLNLFVGVIYEKYITIRMAGLELLTEPQRQWLSIMRHLEHVNPKKTHVPSNPKRATMFAIATSKPLDSFIMGVIVFNCAVMAAKHEGESDTWRIGQEILNEVCTVIFTVECAVKILAFGLKGFFTDSWNTFDFIVVCGSWVDLVVRLLGVEGLVNAAVFRIVRIARVVGRVGRLFKISKELEGLQIIFDTFLNALPSLGSIGLLVLLILYIFAILAMNLFGKVRLHNCLTPHQHFQDAPTAMLTLFGVATADGFACMVHSCMVSEADGGDCKEEGVYPDGSGDCGDPVVAKWFFVTFSITIMFTTIQLTVNIVMSKFDDLTELAGLPLTRENCVAFCECWQQFDYEGTGRIALCKLPELMDLLQAKCRDIGFNELAGEEPIDLRELRLPELPDGQFSRFLMPNEELLELEAVPIGGQDSSREPSSEDGDSGNPAAAKNSNLVGAAELEALPDDGIRYVEFNELLYGLAERKCGKPMPADNKICAEVRQRLGRRMPSLQSIIAEMEETEEALLRAKFLGEGEKDAVADDAAASARGAPTFELDN